ncbi:MAG: M24 family metallopeptidase [Moorellales bacterium]
MPADIGKETYRLRQVRLLAELEGSGAEALLITRPENCLYLTGFSGEGTVVVSASGTWLLTDFRYLEVAQAEVEAAQPVRIEGGWTQTVKRLVTDQGWGRLAFEAEHLTYGRYCELAEALAPVLLVPTAGLVERLRRVKDEAELERLRHAAWITDKAFSYVLERIRPGITEKELALELEYYLGRNGSEGVSFPTIVAAGPRSARPHAVPREEPVREGDLLLLDFGAVWEGYHADLTRTVAVGRAGAKEREVYAVVREAQEEALAAIRAGRTVAEIDSLAREVIARAGYGEYFGHRLGHGVGLAVHEEPALGGEETVLEPGMVVTVEPGIYLPGWGGVRIEDLVVVTRDGCEILSRAPKDFLIVGR